MKTSKRGKEIIINAAFKEGHGYKCIKVNGVAHPKKQLNVCFNKKLWSKFYVNPRTADFVFYCHLVVASGNARFNDNHHLRQLQGCI